MEIITSKDNRLIKEYTRLASSKKHRDSTGLFVIEGVKLIEESFAQSVPLEMAFITELCLEKCNDMAVMQKLFQTVRTIIISESISRRFSEHQTPQGIFAIAKRIDNRLIFDEIYANGRYVFLCDLQDPGNVGTIIRTAEALGLDGVLMSSDCCDPYSPKVIRGGMGSSLRVPICMVDDIVVAISKLKANGVTIYAGVVDCNVTDIKSIAFGNSAVMLIGNEGNGLPEIIKDSCDVLVTIHMSGNAESLNASMAACILMWEMKS